MSQTEKLKSQFLSRRRMLGSVALTGAAVAVLYPATSARASGKAADKSAEAALYSAMRTLWGQHMFWTYATVVEFADASPALGATMARLQRNQDDLGNAIKPYYGDDAGNKLAELLHTHISQAVPVLEAAKAGDKPALNKSVEAWHVNAREIADFLAGANPNWPQDALRDMMKAHIDTTVAYAGAVIGQNYPDAITTFNEAEAHMLHMADVLSRGIIAQFPDKF